MFSTVLHHTRECSQSQPIVRVVPQPKGVGVALFRCPLCGATATTTRSASNG